MPAIAVNPPFPLFADADGQPLDDAYIYIGTANQNPVSNPITVYWDEALTIPAAQPIRTNAGYAVRNGSPSRFYAGANYSILVRDKNGSFVYTAPDENLFSSVDATFIQAGTGAVTRSVQDKLRESVSVKDFGAVGDGVTDDWAAIMAAINSKTYGTGTYVSGPTVYFPPGVYRCGQTIQLKKSVRLYGDTSGMPYNSMATLKFDAGISGIIVHRYNTIDDGKQSPTTTGADSTIIEGLKIFGAYGTADAMGGHGIWLRARAILRNLNIADFTGHGVQIVASSGGSAYNEGNANNWIIENGRYSNNGGWGLYIDGADVNAGKATSIDVSSNGLGGILDSSFLGNTHIAHHAAGNGSGSAGYNTTLAKTSTVSYGGNRYYATFGATPASLVATIPGTDTAAWTLISAGGATSTYPLWVAAQPEGTYFVSSQYRTDSLNARNVFIGCYSEGGYSISDFSLPTLILGGLLTSSGGANLTADLQGPVISSQLQTPTLTVGYGQSDTSGVGIQFPDTNPATNHYWTWAKAVGRWGYQYANLGVPQFINLYDRSATVANGYARDLSGSNGALGLSGYYFGTISQMKWRGLGTAAPTTGDWLQGDIVWSLTPAAGGTIGWVCVTSGTPGTWKTFGAISA